MQMFVKIFCLILVASSVKGGWLGGLRDRLNGDFLGRIINEALSRISFPGVEESPELNRHFNDANEWYQDILRRYNSFLDQIPAQPKDKIQGKIIEMTRKAAEQFKADYLDKADEYLSQGTPAADRYLKVVEMRLNWLGRPRLLMNWTSPKCGTDAVWWYCGEIMKP